MEQDKFIIITKPKDMDKFFPIGTKLQLPQMKVEVVEDPLSRDACKGCPFEDLFGPLADYCLLSVCKNVGEDGRPQYIKFRKLEG